MKILLAVDGSDQSYEAVRSLQHLARAEELHIAHVLDVPIPAYPMMIPEVSQELYKEVEQTMRAEGARLVDRIVSLLPLDAGPVTKHLVTGSPADALVALAEQHKIDLSLLGTRGLGPIKERLIGSVAHRVLTFAPGAKFILPSRLKALKQILLPLEGSYDAEHILRFLETNPFRKTVALTLFTVLPHTRPPWPVNTASSEQTEAQALRNARNFLDELASKLDTMGYQTRVVAKLGKPVEEILGQAGASNSDLILAGSRGRHGVTRMVLGSVSHALLHQGTYALLIVG